MFKKLQISDIINLATHHGYEPAALRAVIAVESGGIGFAADTGKIIIQFEPVWFRRKVPYAPSGRWSVNKVERQRNEWLAFNDAFRINPNGAMESTSIGMMQIMGFHYKLLGFNSVGAMWDFAKVSEANQIELGIRFIKANPKLDKALKNKDWKTFAYYYNGAGYRMNQYDTKLANAYKRYSS